MGADHTPSGRAALLSHALHLCGQLRDTLDRIGPSRFTWSSDYVSAEDDKTIKEVHGLEENLQRRLQEVNEKRNTVLSPISRLPDDLLRLIFQQGHHNQLLEHRVLTIANAFSRDISCVSRRWRRVALDTATLWTYLRFRSPKYLADADFRPIHPWYGSARSLSRVHATNLARSKQALLSVDLHLPRLPGGRTMLKDYLRLCPERVEQLVLSVPLRSAEYDAVVQCVANTKAVLRRLHLSLQHTSTQDNPSPIVDSLLSLDLPRLSEVDLHSVPLPTSFESRYTALLHCRHLHLTITHASRYAPARLLALLKCAPAVEELHIMLLPQQGNFAEEDFSLRLLLPELRRLQCTYSTTSPHLPFSQLIAPKLDQLAVDVMSRTPNVDRRDVYTTDLLNLLDAAKGPDRDQPPIQNLSLKGGIVSSIDTILRRLPELKTLQLTFERHWNVGDETEYVALVENLGLPISSDPPSTQDMETDGQELTPTRARYLCPMLQSLDSVAWATPAHIRPLTQMAARRSAAGCRLPHLKLGGWPGDWIVSRQMENGMESMPAGPAEQYELERALAREVDVLECGSYIWDWTDGGRWMRKSSGARIRDVRFLEALDEQLEAFPAWMP